MRKIEESGARLVPFVYDPAGKSYARQYLSNTCKNNRARLEAAGVDIGARGRVAQKAVGFDLLAAGRAV